MQRNVVEHTFSESLPIHMNDRGAQVCLTVIGTNAQDGVTWVHPLMTHDQMITFCNYDAPSPETIRSMAQRNNLPVESITEVSVLNPYFYTELWRIIR